MNELKQLVDAIIEQLDKMLSESLKESCQYNSL